MKISDLDNETKSLLVVARHFYRWPTADNLERLGICVKAYEQKHAQEHAANLLAALSAFEVDGEELTS